MTQLSLLHTGSGGLETPVTHYNLHTNIHVRRTDPPTSHRAAQTAHDHTQASLAFHILRAYGPGSTRELAERSGMPDSTACHQMLARRLPDLEREGKATCNRVKDEHGKTVCATYKRCSVTGEMALEWRST